MSTSSFDLANFYAKLLPNLWNIPMQNSITYLLIFYTNSNPNVNLKFLTKKKKRKNPTLNLILHPPVIKFCCLACRSDHRTLVLYLFLLWSLFDRECPSRGPISDSNLYHHHSLFGFHGVIFLFEVPIFLGNKEQFLEKPLIFFP